LSILLSNDENTSKDIEIAVKKNLTIINFQACEQYLKDNNLLKQNESISYSKIDWDSTIKKNINVNTTNSSSVSYSLYSSNGTEINKTLCAGINTEILIPIPGFNKEMAANLTKNGFDLYDPNSTYFSDLCIPMKLNDTAVTVEDRSKELNTLGLTCSSGCTYKSINLTIGYISCLCDTNGPKEMASEFGEIVINVFLQSNIAIATCFKTVFKFVRILLIY